jgi:hypothetical protein
MLDLLKRFFSGSRSEEEPGPAAPAPRTIDLQGLHRFPIAEHLKVHNGFPILDWLMVERWIAGVPRAKHGEARAAAERAWLLHFRDALGGTFRVDEAETSLALSSLERNVARAVLAYMERTLKRIRMVLDGIARDPGWGKSVLIVLDDEKQYYEYVSNYYPQAGEFAFSGGMHIAEGCHHFVTIKRDLRSIEPVIAHEMTHGCLAHLPLPAWLNEGIAVNTEHRVARRETGLYTPEQMHAKHRRFWGSAEIQQFWSGKSFLRTDEGNMLSYDLARILVEQFGRDWERFRSFVLAAHRDDAGSAAARGHLGLSLGAAAGALFEGDAREWEPDPSRWEGEK